MPRTIVSAMSCLLALTCTLSAALADGPEDANPGIEGVNTEPLPVKAVRAFPNLRLKMPTNLVNAGDGSGRLFIGSQLGPIYVIPNNQDVKTPKLFLDLSKKVVFNEKQNEEGLLGLAFHPKYKDNGEFFIYYTTTEKPQTSIISRFRVSKDDPDKADPASEEELLRIEQPYWNHNGGTLVFGPDGYLYIALGDGGKANDPHGNGQNLGSLLGSVLRIDVDHKANGKNYAIPKDNPFVGRKGARGEIWAYGFRNPWRMAFDRKTGQFWLGDVGQDLWEEIDLVRKGGNYGWNEREAMHKFTPQGSEPSAEYIEPIWEYHHTVGKSITGGPVYRGKAVPQLQGAYLYGDYVSGKLWALWYDPAKGQVVANRPITPPSKDSQVPVITYGEAEDGEVYFTDYFGQFYRFVPQE